MSDHNDIYRIIESLDAAQRGVNQLPALFKPKDTSPQLSGPYPGRNATRGYLVGEDAGGQDNPMIQAVHRRIVFNRPEWITKYGVDAIDQAVIDVVGEHWDGEEIGSSDVSAYIHMIGEYLRDRGGSREEMDDREPFAEVALPQTTNNQSSTQRPTPQNAQIDKNKYNQLAQQVNQARKSNQMDKVKELTGQLSGMTGEEGFEIDQQGNVKPMAEDVQEGMEAATEDVISTVKKKLGDYLQDVATSIQKDPDLMDRVDQAVDQIGPAVKTIKTDDGHEIKIHGNEDDGFRISIRNRPGQSRFANLDEATMAVEMYCSHRRQRAMSADYIEEKHIS